MTERDAGLDALPVGVAIVHTDGRVLKANRCLADWLGLPAQPMPGLTIDQCLTRASRALYHTHVLPTLQMHGQLQELALQLGGDSHTVPVLACAALERRDDGEVVHLVLSPMRERLRVEAELARSRRAADSAPGVLFELALDTQGVGSFGYLSAGVQTLYGIRPDGHLADEAVWRCVHPDDRAGLLAARAESVRHRVAWTARYRARPLGAAEWRWHDLQAMPADDGNAAVVWHGTITDVTRQREMELAEQLRDTAQQANHAKSEFLARMSHELRTPLNGIIGFAQLMLLDRMHGLQPEQRRRLQVIAASGQHLLELINDVLDISRIEAGRLPLNLVPVDLPSLLRQGIDAIEPTSAAAGVTVAWQGPPDLMAVADPLRLGQVMANLLSNAVKYNRPQGRVDVHLGRQGAETVIEIRDTGPGLTPVQVAQLFQPFNRLGAEGGAAQGTGLGLVITRHLVQAMGGRLDVDSRPGVGSCFRVALPAADARAPAAMAPPPRSDLPVPPQATPAMRATAPARRRRVLCVEDNPVNAMLLMQVMSELPALEVRLESNGEAALRALAAWRPELMLLDMHLGDMDGATLLARARALPGMAEVPAVAVSADAMPEHIARAQAQGFQDYWTKPLDVLRLGDDVMRLLGPLGDG